MEMTVHFSGGSRISHGGANPKEGHQPIIWSKFAKHYMKMKEIGLWEAKV